MFILCNFNTLAFVLYYILLCCYPLDDTLFLMRDRKGAEQDVGEKRKKWEDQREGKLYFMNILCEKNLF